MNIKKISINNFNFDIPLPKFLPIKQRFNDKIIKDIQEEIKQIFIKNSTKMKSLLKKDGNIAIAVGSRGINRIDKIVFFLIEELKLKGVKPFIIPAMGSHGGGDPIGQKNILRKYGISEETMGVPIKSSVRVEKIGEYSKEKPIYIDKIALNSDGIILVNRIKPHTAFTADYESGILKMIAIGLGNPIGARELHSIGIHKFGDVLPAVGQIAINKMPFIFGLAILENAYDQVSEMEILWKDNIFYKEKQLLKEAKKLMPRLLLNKIDVLIVYEIGKDISGAGMDPNITGRASSLFFKAVNPPQIKRIVVLNLSKSSDGNVTGLGPADVTTKKVFSNINFNKTYTNAITSNTLNSAKIPLFMNNDFESIQIALKTCTDINFKRSKIILIKNTLSLEKIYISEVLKPEAYNHPLIDFLGNPQKLKFDKQGNLVFPDF